jgi:phage-related minor tail protein
VSRTTSAVLAVIVILGSWAMILYLYALSQITF